MALTNCPHGVPRYQRECPTCDRKGAPLADPDETAGRALYRSVADTIARFDMNMTRRKSFIPEIEN